MRLKQFLRWLPAVMVLAALGVLAAPKPAHAYRGFGVFFGGPVVAFAPPVVFAGPRVYVAPPAYYVPPPAYYYYPPPAYAAAAPYPPPPGFTCYAKPYICPLRVEHPVNGPCDCPTYGGGLIGGTVR